MTYACGIDFGTSNSTCSLVSADGVELIPLEDDKLTLPSALFFENQGPVSFGRSAINAYTGGDDGRFMRSLKMILGTALSQENTLVNGRALSFQYILARYLKHIKDIAEQQAGTQIDRAVFGRPVFFIEDNPAADQMAEDTLRAIAKSIGFTSVSFQFEPIAAALSHEEKLSQESLSMVVDLGGGTSDFTLIRLGPDLAQKKNRADDILATLGIRVGGTHFDQNFSMHSFMPHFGLGSFYHDMFDKTKHLPMPARIYFLLSDWAHVHSAQTAEAIRETKNILRCALTSEKVERLLTIQDQKLGHALLGLVEDAKIKLTTAHDAHIDLKDVDINDIIETHRTDFEDSIEPYLSRISNAVDEILTQSQITANQLDHIILTGGSTELPIINQTLQNKFPNTVFLRENKLASVGAGLGHHAQRLFF